MAPLKGYALGVLVLLGQRPRGPGACLGPCSPPGQCVCVPRQSVAAWQGCGSPGICFVPAAQAELRAEQEGDAASGCACCPRRGASEPAGAGGREASGSQQRYGAGPAGPAPAGSPSLPWPWGTSTQRSPALPQHRTWLGPCPAPPGMLSLVFLFVLQWASCPPEPSLHRRRRWCPQAAC